MSRLNYVVPLGLLITGAHAFVVPQAVKLSSLLQHPQASSTRQHLFADPSSLFDTVGTAVTGLSSSSFASSSNLLLSFSDQGQNLAGIFFQASLLPYLIFLYFLSFRANRIDPLGNFGFQFVLLFVLSTIPSGIIAKSTYGCSLADVDWMHGGAETLLTVANVLIVSTLEAVLCRW